MSKSPAVKQVISKTYLWISLSLSVATLIVLMYISYQPGIFEHLRWNRMHGFAIAALVLFLFLWFSAAKIRYLSEKRICWAGAFRVVLAWNFASSITPSTIGGGPVASWAMTRENITFGESSAIILYGIMLEQILLVLVIPLTIVASFYVDVVPDTVGLVGETAMVMIYIALLTYAFLLAYSILIKPAFLKKAVSNIFRLPFLRKYRTAMEVEAEHLEQYAHQLRKKPFKFMFYAFVLSSLAWFAKVWIATIVVLSMLPADVFLSLMRSVAMTLAGMFMPTPGGSGGLEGLFYLFQGPLLDRPGFAGLAVFMWRVISFYVVIAIGMMVVSWYLKPKQELERKEEPEPEEVVSSSET